MKILWLTNTPSNASLEFGCSTFGGGWISSLETLVDETNLFELRICFFYTGKTYKSIKKRNVTYYGIPFKKGNVFKRILGRHFAQLVDEDSFFFERIINDFRPDLVHVFGTENGYGKILMNRSEKVLFNLQGMVGAIADVYFPPGFNKFEIFRKSNLNSILRGLTIVHNYRIIRKWAGREKETIRYWKYFVGRTSWDRNYVELLNSNARYFHCEEVMRKDFYVCEWSQPSEVNANSPIVIGTTISPGLYKGLNLVYEVMNLIDRHDIQWKIFGINEEDSVNKVVCKILKLNKKNPNIKFYGHLNTGDLIEQLKTCHFYVHPSFIDNSPNSVCEAMLLGMPVLASSIGGIKTLIKNEETGFLFNPYDKYDLAGLMIHLVNEYENAKQVGQNARLLALKRHSPESIIYELKKIYNFVYNDNP